MPRRSNTGRSFQHQAGIGTRPADEQFSKFRGEIRECVLYIHAVVVVATQVVRINADGDPAMAHAAAQNKEL